MWLPRGGPSFSPVSVRGYKRPEANSYRAVRRSSAGWSAALTWSLPSNSMRCARSGMTGQMRLSVPVGAREPLGHLSPSYPARNQRIMALKGVQRAAQGRVDIPAQGLENLEMAYDVVPDLFTKEGLIKTGIS